MHKVLDSEILQKLGEEAGHSVLAEIVGVFTEEAKSCLKDILSGFEQQRNSQIADKAHFIKTSAASLGCTRLAELLSEIELEAKSANPGDLETKVKQLESVMEESLDALSKQVVDNPAS